MTCTFLPASACFFGMRLIPISLPQKSQIRWTSATRSLDCVMSVGNSMVSYFVLWLALEWFRFCEAHVSPVFRVSSIQHEGFLEGRFFGTVRFASFFLWSIFFHQMLNVFGYCAVGFFGFFLYGVVDVIGYAYSSVPFTRHFCFSPFFSPYFTVLPKI
jgi:hypothetical protein